MRALVTGGAGFIGSHLVDALVARGDQVGVVDNLSSGRRENLSDAISAGASLIEADVGDRQALTAACAELRPEVVFHLAAQIDVRRSVADPVYDLGINVGATIELLNLCVEAGTSRFVLASTGGAIYGEGAGRELPLDENAERRPAAPYGQSKLAAEGYAALYGRLHGLSTVALRLGNVYGPRQDPHGEAGVVAIFCNTFLRGQRPRIFGDGTQTRDYVFVADVVDAFVAAADSGASDAFNVGTGIESSVLDLGRKLAAFCDRDFDPELVPPRPGEVQRIAIDSRRAASELDWAAQTELHRGLELTAESFRRQRA